MPKSVKCDKPYVQNDKDTYLQLGVLADILEVLSDKSGKIRFSTLNRVCIS